jgi:hypothetical protein
LAPIFIAALLSAAAIVETKFRPFFDTSEINVSTTFQPERWPFQDLYASQVTTSKNDCKTRAWWYSDFLIPFYRFVSECLIKSSCCSTSTPKMWRLNY